jgi:putative membrane-bound dehydrogenase-like protein
MRFLSILAIATLFAPPLLSAPPVVTDPNLKLELVASEPDIVTPTGIAVDAKGRIWCIENNTHERPAGYKGPTSDRVRVFEDFDSNGKARKIWTFAEGFRNAMGLSFGPDSALYLATRANVYCMPIKNDKEAERKVIVRLETKGEYPHNGLSGFAWDGAGSMYFGLGENLGAAYKLIGSDGTTLSGGGEGGSIYRCNADGSGLQRVATGFWNPFGMTVDGAGDLFAVDNDPDARGPCRLLHIIDGGDYGYRFRYGRKGTHPFQSWNGELPGTLPMVAGTSEAPCGIIACDFARLPSVYSHQLLVASWGDHTIETFKLTPRGASYSGQPRVVVRGDENFRPVGLAIAPDGSIVMSDWVDKSYPVHGKGRIWRLNAKSPTDEPLSSPPYFKWRDETSIYRLFESAQLRPSWQALAISRLTSPDLTRNLMPMLASPDPFMVSAAVTAIGRPGNSPMLFDILNRSNPPTAMRLGILLALRRTGDEKARVELYHFLDDPDPGVRRTAIQWVAEEGLKNFSVRIDQAASKAPVTREVFEAWLAARAILDGKTSTNPSGEIPGEEYVATILKDSKQPLALRSIAVRMLRPDHPQLTPEILSNLFQEGDAALREAVVRTALLRSDEPSQAMLRRIAMDESQPMMLRALAVTGLGQTADKPETRHVLELASRDSKLKDDAERSIGRRSSEKKRTIDEWRQELSNGSGDAAAGERIFYQPRGVGCFKCHRVDNRGGAVGPDLSFIARSTSRDKLIESILEPSKEIAPAFTAWKVLTRDGKEHVGLILGETFDSYVLLGTVEGKTERIHRTQIEERTALTKSLMPDDLANQLTKRDFLDLLAYLLERK